MICQLHQLLLELVAGGAKKDLSAAHARKLLAGVRPRDLVGKTRRTGRRAREDTGAHHFNPARSAHIPMPTLRTSHFPDPPRPSLRPCSAARLDTEGRHEPTLGLGPFVRLLDGAMTEVGTRTSMRMCLRPAPSRSQLGGRGTSLAGARLGYLVSGVEFRIAESTSRIA